ncbi:MAG TPA: hypothetical protein VFM55_18950 [Micromonosporaceae bacterium]|nr:hypothetical protein [Micromonosporaceae bacterium]
MTPAMRRLRDEISRTLSTAVALDRIEAGAGDDLRDAAAVALAATRSRVVRNSERNGRSEAQAARY